MRVRELKERQAFDFKNNQEKYAEKIKTDFDIRVLKF